MMMNWVLLVSCCAAADAPSSDPVPVPETREDVKKGLEAHKKATPRLPNPPAGGDNRLARVNNGRFRAYYLPFTATDMVASREPDPAMTLDNTFKVKLFWITSRMNHCIYCLGHQEHKLLAAGVDDDGIAVLDGDWAAAKPEEKAAYAFTRKLTISPDQITEADLQSLRAFYTPTQVLEIIVTVAGYNATNRWTGGLNIPAEEDGGFFRKPDSPIRLDTFLTPTSPKYAKMRSQIALLEGPPTRAAREPRDRIEAALAAAKTRKPLLPMADGEGSNWEKLLRTFPKAGEGRIRSLKNLEKQGKLSAKLRAQIAWIAARQDRAWYALADARNRLRALGMSDAEIEAIDDPQAKRSEADAAVLNLTQKLTAMPTKVSDADVAAVRKHFNDFETAEVVYTICNAAFFDRVTEAARLPLD
ncbi:carboxymuconolactone decarboxylase family protein [Tuwongella immobilis]|uniref:Carboxymuconolactone decarboxylase-like domain-containing protein n=1 Tax=Tuwongella immobilis TaxID=692036 RepID=A0A6C2YKA9_9BACT|nr:hypothetical protein [Tuwongella immobilis]VIP01545.1 Uncharacterized protein OS=Singulisphaera acidiphila (strain ATCC BAA-1392 / DSM 18658 / VKM B-2454 / MOB10) GN=Sinac_2543 PE=4 SV=1 [Tuwongella immobilis]VTR98727.1 Uncharacterized protein OS=Singulisphaera acidiphila (strain ATCC BAA-1392 / DSM 18658 / VKM B-2454 / MOB10) GN=Sinac_2543 PE=4 SV=1 [Tuwongella immobilis]